jgi:hypothetical protein
MTTRDEMVATIGAALFEHRLTLSEEGKSQCKCGWWVNPLLDSLHRIHQADEILAAVLMATAQLQGERQAEIRDQVYLDAAARTHAVGLLLASSGDITPMGTRMLDKIWQTAGVND